VESLSDPAGMIFWQQTMWPEKRLFFLYWFDLGRKLQSTSAGSCGKLDLLVV